MAHIMFLLRERSGDGELDSPVFVTEEHGRAVALADDYIKDLQAGVHDKTYEELCDLLIGYRRELDASRPTPACHVVVEVPEADRTLTLEAVMVV